MSEERLRRAAGALERSVAGVDVMERLEALGRRWQRQRSSATVLAVLVAVAVFGGAALGLRALRTTDPVAGPLPADPATPARVVAALPVYGDPTAVAVGGGSVWVTTDGPNWLRRIDPATGEYLTIAVPPTPTRLAVSQDAVWVLSPDDNSVSNIDPATNERVATVPVGRSPSGLAVGAGAVWVSSRLDGTVKRIDPATNRVVATIRVGRAPGSLTVAGGVVWVSLPEQGGLGRIDPASNRSTVVPVARCCDGEVAAGDRALWVANALDGTLVRVDPVTGRVVARVLLPRATDQRPHQVAVGEGAVWVTSASARRGIANLLWRVDPGSNQVNGTTDLGPTPAKGIPNGVAAGHGSVWVAGADVESLLRLAPG